MDDELFGMLASRIAALGLDLVDLEVRTGLVRVVVDRPGGADLDSIAAATRAVSAELDRHDPQPGHRYTLEVTSPGVERPLRSPGQFARAVGETVSVRTVAGTSETERRVKGVLVSADEEGFVLAAEGSEARRFSYSVVERARTVFEWPRSAPPSGRGRAPERRPHGARLGGVARAKKVTSR